MRSFDNEEFVAGKSNDACLASLKDSYLVHPHFWNYTGKFLTLYVFQLETTLSVTSVLSERKKKFNNRDLGCTVQDIFHLSSPDPEEVFQFLLKVSRTQLPGYLFGFNISST